MSNGWMSRVTHVNKSIQIHARHHSTRRTSRILEFKSDNVVGFRISQLHLRNSESCNLLFTSDVYIRRGVLMKCVAGCCSVLQRHELLMYASKVLMKCVAACCSVTNSWCTHPKSRWSQFRSAPAAGSSTYMKKSSCWKFYLYYKVEFVIFQKRTILLKFRVAGSWNSISKRRVAGSSAQWKRNFSRMVFLLLHRKIV